MTPTHSSLISNTVCLLLVNPSQWYDTTLQPSLHPSSLIHQNCKIHLLSMGSCADWNCRIYWHDDIPPHDNEPWNRSRRCKVHGSNFLWGCHCDVQWIRGAFDDHHAPPRVLQAKRASFLPCLGLLVTNSCDEYSKLISGDRNLRCHHLLWHGHDTRG